jgi:hypothetical protein
VSVVVLTALEIGLRAYNSLASDGRLQLTSSSVNEVSHPVLGWMSPADVQYEKEDPCYGKGRVTFNAEGFRAPPLEQAKGAHPIICILGDSTMQGYQLPDGTNLAHQLTKALIQRGERPYVLPLAVDGYGTVQQWMLYEQYCRPLNPDVIIIDWDDNDAVNNSFELERYSGPGSHNLRPRPYLDLETDEVTLRRPYPLSLSDTLDDLLLVRFINTVLLKLDMRPAEDPKRKKALEEGYAVALRIAKRFEHESARKIALVSTDETRARELFRAAQFELAVHRTVPRSMRCLPRDPHPNREGHALMLDALLETMVGPSESPLKHLIGDHEHGHH